MERLVRVAEKLRKEQNFHGYIHLKTIPGASEELIKKAGLYADRLSVNIELPSEKSLKSLAPEKTYEQVFTPMKYIGKEWISNQEEKKLFKHSPVFASAGQSTQLIVGASPENDFQILNLANDLYNEYKLKRVYYSGYVPISQDQRLPLLLSPPVVRENRIYQADWLIRFYDFKMNEIVNLEFPNLDLDIDPKLAWALRNLGSFPIEINKADYELILRVPGIGVNTAQKIVAARKFASLDFDQLKKMGAAINRAKYFITCKGKKLHDKDFSAEILKKHILSESTSKRIISKQKQLQLF